MVLDRVAVSPPVALLQHVAGLGEIGDDRKRAAFRDSEGLGHVAQAQPGIARDAEQNARVIGEETPLRHQKMVAI